ncbi:MAG: PilZ domain-containing protein [Mariprofundaceae bacterium]
MNMKANNLIHHPEQVPVEIQALDCSESYSEPVDGSCLGELAIHCLSSFRVGAVVELHVPMFDSGILLHGHVIWFHKAGGGYLIGISFQSEDEAFRMRMVEQLCHIEAYRKDVAAKQGRILTREEAAAEWIARYSEDFPEVRPSLA